MLFVIRLRQAVGKAWLVAAHVVLGLVFVLGGVAGPVGVGQAAQLSDRSDTLSRLKSATVANHAIRWTLPAGVAFEAGDKARVDFPAAFTTSAGWVVTDFAFSDGTARTVVDAATNTTPNCGLGADDVTVEVSTTNDQFIITACSGFTSSGTGATVTFTVFGTAPDGTLTNPSTVGSYRVDIVGDDKGNGFGGDDDTGQLALVIVADDQAGVSVTVQAAVPPPSGGGGGGGGGGAGVLPPTSAVIFSGRAYPQSTVTLLKDAQLAATTVAGSDARFAITLSGLSTGIYIFSVYTEDKSGLRSNATTFPVSVTAGVTTTIGGIFLAPTLAVDKSEVKRGEPVAIFGQVAPQSELTITINSEQEFFIKATADDQGVYLYSFDTTPLETGQHLAKSKAVLDAEISSTSRAISFVVGSKTVLAKPTTTVIKGDVNNDGRVYLIDFSILAYWFKRASPPANVDLNGDGAVDLVDFSIMAFNWTG